MPNQGIYVLDTSAIIAIKQEVKAQEQWGFAKHLEGMVKSRHITFPLQVTREIRGQSHIDLPEAWALGVEPDIGLPRSPNTKYLEEVMRVALNVVEENAEDDPADPYVLSLALQLWREREPEDCFVVTEDNVDRMPLKLSIRTACTRLSLNCIDTRDFPEALGFRYALRAVRG